jgi:hypothetical protein
VWGDINRGNDLAATAGAIDFESKSVTLQPWMPTLFRTYGVTHVLTPFPLAIPGLTPILEGEVYVYRVERSHRARVVPTATVLDSDADVTKRLKAPEFDPDRDVVLSSAALGQASNPPSAETIKRPDVRNASIISENSREVVVETESEESGFLVFADTFYAGWRAVVDGRSAEVYRANLSSRAVAVPAGRHTVRFVFDPPGFTEGFAISVVGLAGLLVWVTTSWRRRVLA